MKDGTIHCNEGVASRWKRDMKAQRMVNQLCVGACAATDFGRRMRPKIPRMNKSQIQTMISIVCEQILHFLTSSSNSFSLVETLLHSGCDQDKRRILGSSMTLLPRLLSSEAGYYSLVSLLSSWPHFMELESSVVTHEDVVLLGSTLLLVRPHCC